MLPQVNQFQQSTLLVPYNGNFLQYFGIEGQDVWANLGYESVGYPSRLNSALNVHCTHAYESQTALKQDVD